MIPEPAWTRSSHCGTSTCVEITHRNRQILMRDSKNPDQAPLAFSANEWSAFLFGVRAGDFDRQ